MDDGDAGGEGGEGARGSPILGWKAAATRSIFWSLKRETSSQRTREARRILTPSWSS